MKLVVNFLFYFRPDEAEVGAWGTRGGPRGPEAGAHGRVSRSPSELCCWNAA